MKREYDPSRTPMIGGTLAGRVFPEDTGSGSADCVPITISGPLTITDPQPGIIVPFIPPDMVNHPPHYNTGKIEVIEYIMDKFKDDYLLGQVCKYISRAKHKGNEIQDLEKAEWYLKKAIEDAKGRMGA